MEALSRYSYWYIVSFRTEKIAGTKTDFLRIFILGNVKYETNVSESVASIISSSLESIYLRTVYMFILLYSLYQSNLKKSYHLIKKKHAKCALFKQCNTLHLSNVFANVNTFLKIIRNGYSPLMHSPLVVLLTFGFIAPALIFVQQRKTFLMKDHQNVFLCWNYVEKSDSFLAICVCIENSENESKSFGKGIH